MRLVYRVFSCIFRNCVDDLPEIHPCLCKIKRESFVNPDRSAHHNINNIDEYKMKTYKSIKTMKSRYFFRVGFAEDKPVGPHDSNSNREFEKFDGLPKRPDLICP